VRHYLDVSERSRIPQRWAWPLAGVVAGVAGLATSYLVANALQLRTSPVIAVGDLVIRLTPGTVAEKLIHLVGHKDKPLLVTGILIVLLGVFALAGRLARTAWWAAAVVFGVITVVGAVAVGSEHGATGTDEVPVAIGLLTWLFTLSLLTQPLTLLDPDRATGQNDGETRRGFLLRAGMVGAGTVVLGVAGRLVGRGRRRVEAARAHLKLPKVTKPVVPDGTQLAIPGITRWNTSSTGFYQIHTAIVPPTIVPSDWQLRIHGKVDKEITLTYQDLLDRQFTEQWLTLNCVSNPVGGNLIGNAWWSGVRLADIIAEAGPQAGADAVKQTSDDGWTCGTPLAALTDDRNAMLAVAMNGAPLPIEHGFPVRTLVPGLYGYVSACKWVVDMEVTSFDAFQAYWTERGWGEMGPVKMSSRVDVPRSGAKVAAGEVTFAGVAWSQNTGIAAVEIQVDSGSWLPATLAAEPSIDSWVQWSTKATVAQGGHLVRVRATDKNGLVQTGARQGVLPDGATGWDSSDFKAT
jgi:DMSO/TMAO reductase YedYZ molybdopterin-dependent catalytic subunit